MVLDEDWSDSVPIDLVFMNPVTLLVLKSTLLPGRDFGLKSHRPHYPVDLWVSMGLGQQMRLLKYEFLTSSLVIAQEG